MIDWDILVRKHGPMVWRTAWRILGRVEDAQDCLQETFLSAVKLSRREKIRNWAAVLRHLATARALDRLRERIKQEKGCERRAEVNVLAQNRDNPLEIVQAAELACRLREALVELPDRHAEVFALRYLAQRSYRQIGAALGLRTNAVGVLLHEARQQLRVLLGCDADGADNQ